MLDGLAPRRRRKRAPAQKTPAERLPIARVVIDVQATHLGRTFDYLVEERDGDAALPGVRVRVRFGRRLIDGFIWERADASESPTSTLRYLERVVSPRVVVSDRMREDVTLIADAFGGTRANILRLAVPPRVARVDDEYRTTPVVHARRGEELAAALEEPVAKGFMRLDGDYSGIRVLRDAIGSQTYASVVWDNLPGPRLWAKDVAWAVACALMRGRCAVVVLPDAAHVEDMASALASYGLREFAPAASARGEWVGDVVRLEASMPPDMRYRSYMAVACGQVRCVIGLRAAMYAPVEGPALFAIVDDVAYQNADGMMPYANARDVLRLRARAHGGVLLVAGHARSPVSQWEVDGRESSEIHALQSVTKDTAPWIRWLNHEELVRLSDQAIGARMPHTAVAVVNRALRDGPVLLSIPRRDRGTVLACASCGRRARCPRCFGPLLRVPGSAAQCQWCGAAAVGWTCRDCKGDRLRAVRIGSDDTARELQGLFRDVPVMISTPNQPRGVIADVVAKPQIVIATPGAEPRVRPMRGRGVIGYQAVVILDAWTSLYAPGIDARVDTLTSWMRAASMGVSRKRGGQVLLVGEADASLAHALMAWDSRILAAHEVEERRATVLPPVVGAAAVWGERGPVMDTLRGVGVLDGDWSTVTVDGVDWPAVLGPVSIAPEYDGANRRFEGSVDRVRAIVRVERGRMGELAVRLRAMAARHAASRGVGELRFAIDPKDVL